MKKIPPEKKIRLRFPPSPTGALHVGNARTLLFNYLFAKKHGGSIVLRIEDTDTARSEEKWMKNIVDELTWLGLTWDEGPYKQSERLNIYKTYLEKLLTEKKAYWCNCAAQELEAKRQEQMKRGVAPKYDGRCRDKNNASGVIRFKIAEKKVAFTDLVKGDVEFDMALLGDIVIAKNLETPLYHFAVVVDDYTMGISHIIRGDDHLSNTPRQILIQEALGFNYVTYAHLPQVLNPDKSKMSKRAGDTAVSDYHQNGYLPETLINFMALLGWNPGTEREFFTLAELVEEFSIEKIQASGAVFDLKKLDHLNGHYIRQKSNRELLRLCQPYLKDMNTTAYDTDQLEKIIEAYKARLKKLSEVKELTDFFFLETLTYDKKILPWKDQSDGEVKASLQHCYEILLLCDIWDKESLEKLLVAEATAFAQASASQGKNANKGMLLWPLRVALSGKEASASPFEIAEILGKEKTLERILQAKEKLT